MGLHGIHVCLAARTPRKKYNWERRRCRAVEVAHLIAYTSLS